MDWLWTWGGTCFGYRDGDNLWTRHGHHVGRFAGSEVYACNGAYLGEMMGTSRLITRQTKTRLIQGGFTPFGRRIVHTFYPDYSGYAMLAGYDDFPAPEALQ
jgi:hypothetical protein